MTQSLGYQRQKHPGGKPVAAKDQIATDRMLKPMKSKTDEPVSALSNPQDPPPYDVHTQGSLTYFQFYLDEVVQSANAPEPTPKRQSISTAALLGAGFVATTVVSGLLIGDALNKPAPPPDTKVPPVKPKPRSAVSMPRPISAAPETLQAPRFVSRSHRESPPQAISQSVAAPRVAPSQNPVDPAPPLSFAPMLPSVTLAAVPETFTVSRRSPKRPVTGAPAPAGMKPLVRPGYQDLPALQRPPQSPLTTLKALPASAIRETLAQLSTELPTGIAAPERIREAAAIAPPDPAQPPETLTRSTPFPPAPSRAEASPAPLPQAKSQLTAPIPARSEPATPATDPPPFNSTSTAIESKLPNRAVQTELTDDLGAIAASPSALSGQPSQPALPSRLQDFVTLAQSSPLAQPRTFLPLTQQAATEAGHYQQLEKFAIRRVAVQDYQKEWAVSSNSASFGYPAYGFIDYQRQVIVVLNEQPPANPVESQKATPPNSSRSLPKM